MLRLLMVLCLVLVSACSTDVTAPLLSPGVAPVQVTTFAIGYGTRLTDERAVVLAQVLPSVKDTTLQVRWYATAQDRSLNQNVLSTSFNHGQALSLAPGSAYEVWALVRPDTLSAWKPRYFRYERGYGPVWPAQGTVWAY